ncbi:MAG: phosphoglycerate kinase [Phycisphaerae bacterium]|jgi:phosphoglycerate kinase|nr:phosphoglycerate kinase [Phycisphaerae bacterium]NLG41818.1 phosphoglycerate kinase [Phycisphaerae bacterium]HOO16923.1 phosphoglycerate kinase [Phycisphaerae bacterium]HPC22754.1 phosphoglycerate kinase [Phycisphaerae bacterium]HRS28597.1 phosphoglycerate kinase [Phycisphaerae bacterium]
MNKKSVRDLNVSGRRVLIRADLNVPLDKNRNVTDDRRIRMFLPTLQHVLKGGGRAIVISHLGRPSGNPAEDQAFSLRPVAAKMEQLLGRPVKFASDCIGPEADAAVQGLKDGEVLLLENLRFHKAETVIDKKKKNPDGKLTPEQEAARQKFAQALAPHGEIYVNDAFGTCHRQHVSMYDVPLLTPKGNRVVGFLVEKELQYLGQALQSPKRPFVAILGGAKVSDKIGVIKNLLQRVDQILIGGAMTYTFWAAQGKSVGKSLCERDKLDLAKSLLEQGGGKIVLPVDSVAAAELKAGVATQVIAGDLPADMMGLDIGPKTIELFRKYIQQAGTIVWNGPVGAFETPPFEKGTFELARAIAEATDRGAVTVIGGGDSAAAVEQAGLAERMSHISTGGGASLEFLEGKPFKTIEVLDDA